MTERASESREGGGRPDESSALLAPAGDPPPDRPEGDWLDESCTCQSETAAVRRMVLKHARDAFGSQEAMDRQWEALNYLDRPDLTRAIEEYNAFAELLSGLGMEVSFLPQADGVGLDSIYVRDATVMCDQGVILCNMGKAARRDEPEAQGRALAELLIPVVGAIEGDGTVEGGDVVWLDERTVAVGRGYRTNHEGIRQLGALLEGTIDELIEVPLPH